MKMERINVASAIMVDGVTRMSADNNIAEIEYDTKTQIYTVVGRKNGHVTLVHSTNIQWSRPLEQETSGTRSRRAIETQEAQRAD